MARTMMVSAVTALGVVILFAMMWSPPTTTPEQEAVSVGEQRELLQRLGSAEAELARLLTQAETQPPSLEDPAQAAEARLEALEARLLALETEARPPESAGEAVPPPLEPTVADAEAEQLFQTTLRNLEDSSENVAFSATIELARMKDVRAAGPLIEVLRTHRDYYVRLGAATALGAIKALDGVPDLIDALDDKDELVRTAAADALVSITKEEGISYASGGSRRERREAQEAWRRWWADHEAFLRSR